MIQVREDRTWCVCVRTGDSGNIQGVWGGETEGSLGTTTRFQLCSRNQQQLQHLGACPKRGISGPRPAGSEPAL